MGKSGRLQMAKAATEEAWKFTAKNVVAGITGYGEHEMSNQYCIFDH